MYLYVTLPGEHFVGNRRKRSVVELRLSYDAHIDDDNDDVDDDGLRSLFMPVGSKRHRAVSCEAF